MADINYQPGMAGGANLTTQGMAPPGFGQGLAPQGFDLNWLKQMAMQRARQEAADRAYARNQMQLAQKKQAYDERVHNMMDVREQTPHMTGGATNNRGYGEGMTPYKETPMGNGWWTAPDVQRMSLSEVAQAKGAGLLDDPYASLYKFADSAKYQPSANGAAPTNNQGQKIQSGGGS